MMFPFFFVVGTLRHTHRVNTLCYLYEVCHFVAPVFAFLRIEVHLYRLTLFSVVRALVFG